MQIWPGRIKDLRKAKFLFVLYCICKYGCSVLKAVTRKGQKAMAIQIRARWLVETSLNCQQLSERDDSNDRHASVTVNPAKHCGFIFTFLCLLLYMASSVRLQSRSLPHLLTRELQNFLFYNKFEYFWRNMFWVKRSANLIALFNTFMASMKVIIKHPMCCLWNSECSSYETAEVQILQNTRQRQSSFQNKNGKWIMRSFLWLFWRSQKLSVCWSINGRLVRQYICDDRAEQV